jgi:hypothetical protein
LKIKNKAKQKHKQREKNNKLKKKNKKKNNKMSWQTYVDDHLMCDIDGTGHHLTAAAILGHDGSVWAQSTSFPQVIFICMYVYICMYAQMYFDMHFVSFTSSSHYFYADLYHNNHFHLGNIYIYIYIYIYNFSNFQIAFMRS